MRCFKRGEKGFTLIELLIVIAILGVLAAVVIPNVVGLMGRGGLQAYETDEEVIQLACAAFYSDTHAGLVFDPNQDFDGSTWANLADTRWGCNCTAADAPVAGYMQLTHPSGHYYPTAIAYVGNHSLYMNDSQPDLDNDDFEAWRVDDETTGLAATDSAISAHCIWTGMLLNEAGSYDNNDTGCTDKDTCGVTDRLDVSPNMHESALYINESPESAMATNTYNGVPEPGGGYAWIVGKNGSVYGCYKGAGTAWYAGFSGAYP